MMDNPEQDSIPVYIWTDFCEPLERIVLVEEDISLSPEFWAQKASDIPLAPSRYKKDKESIDAAHRLYVEKNRERVAEYQKNYYQKNKEKRQKYQKEYRMKVKAQQIKPKAKGKET